MLFPLFYTDFMSSKTIIENKSILEALRKLDKITKESQTLFVLNREERMVGTLTDGDIRRYLVAGGNLSDEVKNAMYTDFSFIKDGEDNIVALIRDLKVRDITLVPSLDNQGRIVNIYDLTNYKSHLPIDAVLMAGGKGERLRPLTEKTPKPLVKVGDKCIIDYNIDNLIAYGIKHLNVTVNYLGEQLEEHFAESRNGVQVRTIREPKFLGTIGSIKFVDTFHNDYILVMNSDLFTDIDFEDFFLHFREHNAEMSVAAVPYNVSIAFPISLYGRSIFMTDTGNYYVLNHLVLITGLTDRTLRSYIASGILQGEKINGLWHFTPEQVENFIRHPAVLPSIQAKRNALVHDFLLNTYKSQPEACIILDMPGANRVKVAEYFCYRINTENFRDIHFSYDYVEGIPRVILKGKTEDVLNLTNGYYQDHPIE